MILDSLLFQIYAKLYSDSWFALNMNVVYTQEVECPFIYSYTTFSPRSSSLPVLNLNPDLQKPHYR